MVKRYGRFALLSVLAIVLTGGAAAMTQIGSAQQLLGTNYGRLLTLKVAVVAWTLLFATVGRLRGFVGGSVDITAVRDPIRAEVVGVLLVLLTTAALANAAPPAPVPSASGAAGSGGAVIVVLLLAGGVIAGAFAHTAGRRVRGFSESVLRPLSSAGPRQPRDPAGPLPRRRGGAGARSVEPASE